MLGGFVPLVCFVTAKPVAQHEEALLDYGHAWSQTFSSYFPGAAALFTSQKETMGTHADVVLSMGLGLKERTRSGRRDAGGDGAAGLRLQLEVARACLSQRESDALARVAQVGSSGNRSVRAPVAFGGPSSELLNFRGTAVIHEETRGDNYVGHSGEGDAGDESATALGCSSALLASSDCESPAGGPPAAIANASSLRMTSDGNAVFLPDAQPLYPRGAGCRWQHCNRSCDPGHSLLGAMATAIRLVVAQVPQAVATDAVQALPECEHAPGKEYTGAVGQSRVACGHAPGKDAVAVAGPPFVRVSSGVRASSLFMTRADAAPASSPVRPALTDPATADKKRRRSGGSQYVDGRWSYVDDDDAAALERRQTAACGMPSDAEIARWMVAQAAAAEAGKRVTRHSAAFARQ